jgi:putative ABC transport system ATP-binding protein
MAEMRIGQEQPLIRLSGVSKTYESASGSFPALINVRLDFYEGEFVGVIGKSGSGKSTLVNMITGIDRPSEGQVLVSGQDIHAMKEGEQARWRGLNLGVVFQFFQLLPMLTLVENVLLPMDFCDKYAPASRLRRALDLLDMVGLADEAYQLPGAVSGGQQQSAAIARALANDPPIIVADEPTGNLDAKTADSVYASFESLANEGRTIIMITHDPEIESRLSRKVLLSDGEVIDPVLVKAFPWLLRPSLMRLGHQLERRTLMQDETVDIAGEFRDRVILVENGEFQLSFEKPPFKKRKVNLSWGGYFAGPGLIDEYRLQQYSVQVQSDSAQIAWLGREAFVKEIDCLSEGWPKFQSHLRGKMLDEGEDHEEEGVVG